MKQYLRYIRFSLANNWYVLLIGGISLLVAALILLFRLGSLTGGLSTQEYDLWQQVHINGLSLLDVFRNATYLPYKAGLWVLQYLPFHGNGGLRITGALFGLVGAIGFFSLLKLWYSNRVAYFGTALFLCSSWLLHTARYASPAAVYAATAILLALWAWVLSGRHRRIALPLFVACAVLSLYIPGAAWLLVPAVIWQRKNLGKAFRRLSFTHIVIILTAAALLLVPMLVSLVWPLQGNSLDALRGFLALPEHLPGLRQIASNLANIPKELFITSRGDPTMHLGRLPLLDAFVTAMFVVGMYACIRDWTLDRVRFVFAGLLVGTILIGLGSLPMAFLLPFIYLVAIAGASYLLQEWLQVFPRNPFARWLGISLVVITVVATLVYQLTNYFVAWPEAPDTKTTFSRRL